MKRLSALFGHVFDALAGIAALILLAMVVVVSGDIILRNVARSGFPWANEVSEYALYIITLFVAPWLLRKGQHVRIDLVLTVVPPRVAWLMEGLGDIIGFIVCLIMMRYGVKMVVDSAMLGSLTIKNLVFPEWWLLVPLPVVFALIATEFVFRFDRLRQGEKGRRVEATSAS